MKKFLLSALCLISMMYAQAADYYWVGGGGNWSDINHWSTTSGGSVIHSIVPSAGDNVIFDANSGFGTTTATRTITLDANGFCNNMTWINVPNNPVFSRSAGSTYTVEVWGNLSLDPTVTFTSVMTFRGGTNNTFATNGTVLGNFGFDINKPGGRLQLVDSFICPSNSNNAANGIQLIAGTFDMAGKKLKARQINSLNNNERAIDMTGSSVELYYRWDFRGTNKTLDATGSVLSTGVYLFSDAGAYSTVSCNGVDYNNFGVSNTYFRHLTFTRAVNSSYAQINEGNTIDTLIYLGQGRMFNNNTVGHVEFNMLGRIMGANNTLGYANCMGNFSVEVTGTTTFDTLLLAANKIANLNGTININKYLRAEGLPCDAFTEINGDLTAPGIFFAAGATADIDNVLLTGVKAFGDITPIAVTGIDGENNEGFTITPPPSAGGTTLYWVGGAGDWNDRSHWSTTSGGTGGACIPFINDNIIFNDASGFSAGNNIVTTSGNSYCHDLTWNITSQAVVFNEASSVRLNIYGSVVLSPQVTMNAELCFAGADPASTITFNGSTLGTLAILIMKTDAGALTFTDDWTNTAGTINLTDGILNMNNRTLSFYGFTSNATYPTKTLNIQNTLITVASRWEFTGVYKYMDATGSHITSTHVFISNGLEYPSVELTYGGGNPLFSITSTTFGRLLFSSDLPTSPARIGTNNTIRRLEFSGAGTIAGGGNIIDSLLLASSRNYTFAGTNTINDYLLATAPVCTALTEMRGSPTATLNFASDADIDLNNVYMQNMIATGVSPIAFTGADAGGNTGWDISSAAGSSRYWIGGAGDWNDNAHWSTTSGGTGGACIPTVFDDVYFNAASGFATGNNTVTIANGNAYARNIDWTGAPASPIWSKGAAWTIEAWGENIILPSAGTFNVSPLTLKGGNATTLTGNVSGNFDVLIDKQDGSLAFANNYSNTLSDFQINTGTLNAAGRTLSVSSIDNQILTNVSSIDISDATITASTLWRYSGVATNHALNAANSTITTSVFVANGLTYDRVNVTGIATTSAQFSNATINRLHFTTANSSSQIGINGINNTIGTLDYRGSGGIYGTGNSIDTLIFFPGNIYTLTAGTNTTITGAWYGSGTPCRLTEIVSSNATANATITKTAGNVDFDYVRVRRITGTVSGTGTGPFVAREHSIDQGNNTGWDIAPYNGSSPIYGLGPDISIPASDFPYTLYTTGFFGSPSSSYVWNDNSTADTLVITGPGTYSVNVNFVDGCNVSGDIVVTEAIVMPVNLVSFTASALDCQTTLNWEVSDAVNFSHFVIERSIDGRQFEALGQVAYVNGEAKYAYSDLNPVYGDSYYRLRLTDRDGTHKYSNVLKVRSTCQAGLVRVYPTITSNTVTIELPAAYANARMQLLNVAGQQINVPVNGNGLVRRVNLQPLASGHYLLQVITGGEIKTFRIVRQ